MILDLKNNQGILEVLLVTWVFTALNLATYWC